jgi:hypothetical protein
MSRKLIVTLIGMGMSLVWAIFKFEISYLVAALGFAGGYLTANVADTKVRK